MSESSQPSWHACGESAALLAGVVWSPAMYAALFNPESWRESLDAYAHATNLAVALVDEAGRLRGACYNPRPTWSRLHAAQEMAGDGCPFALAPRRPCMCVQEALARRELVVKSAIAQGWCISPCPSCWTTTPWGRCSPAKCSISTRNSWCWSTWPCASGYRHRRSGRWHAWSCRSNGQPCACMGVSWPPSAQAFLHARYHTLLDTQRLEALEQRFQERTAALHHEIAERQRLEREAQRRTLRPPGPPCGRGLPRNP